MRRDGARDGDGDGQWPDPQAEAERIVRDAVLAGIVAAAYKVEREYTAANPPRLRALALELEDETIPAEERLQSIAKWLRDWARAEERRAEHYSDLENHYRGGGK